MPRRVLLSLALACNDAPRDEECGNGRDDDGDGRVDCEDGDCWDVADCDLIEGFEMTIDAGHVEKEKFYGTSMNRGTRVALTSMRGSVRFLPGPVTCSWAGSWWGSDDHGPVFSIEHSVFALSSACPVRFPAARLVPARVDPGGVAAGSWRLGRGMCAGESIVLPVLLTSSHSAGTVSSPRDTRSYTVTGPASWSGSCAEP